jgi:acetyl-CoA decarbonylase/synthase complex subunit gamma
MHYTVPAGLYAVGQPGTKSPILVTANYKLTFDHLRRELARRDLWLLALETFGINVWCAAGKGTFGTAELMNRVKRTGLARVVSHRTLIAPQLGAPGVAAHEVKKATGFQVRYGPIRADDLPEFLDRGMEATTAMRRTRFTLKDRVVLIPVELVNAWKASLLLCVLVLALSALTGRNLGFSSILSTALPCLIIYLGALVMGSVVTPVLLPWLPGAAFSLKGAELGLLWAALAALVMGSAWKVADIVALFLMAPAVTAYFALNFTGCTTFTSLSGVEKEMRVALPVIIFAVVAGAIAWMIGLVI